MTSPQRYETLFQRHDGDSINLYYDAVDTTIALARGKISQLLQWLDRNGTEVPH